jgi:hypothetical protein
VVLAREQDSGEKQLIGYLVQRSEAAVTVEELQRYLRARLPEYLVPSALVLVGKLPLTANGKLDRQALPSPEEAAAQRQIKEPPQTAVEQKLAGIWEQVLRRERIGRHENFFDIGGHSLLATQIISRVREQFRADVAVRTLFEQPTISLLAHTLEELAADPPDEEEELVPVARDGYRVRRSTSTASSCTEGG